MWRFWRNGCFNYGTRSTALSKNNWFVLVEEIALRSRPSVRREILKSRRFSYTGVQLRFVCCRLAIPKHWLHVLLLWSSVATAVFFTRSGFFLFSLGLWVFSWKSVFFLLWSNFRNVCCITVFSFQEYSSFTCVVCRVSSQYSWVGLGLITKLFEI